MNIHMFFDVRLDGFFPDSHSDEHSPCAALNFQTEVTTYRHALAGGKDGYVRMYDEAADNDDGTAIASYVDLPAARLSGDDYREGILMELIATIPLASGDVSWSLKMGRTHEEAASATAAQSGTWTGLGLRHVKRPQKRGASAIVRLANGEARRWAFEQIIGMAEAIDRTVVP